MANFFPNCGNYRVNIILDDNKYCVNFILDDKMLQYCHVFVLPTFKAYTCQQYVCVLSAILSANGQTWHEYAQTAVWLKKG